MAEDRITVVLRITNDTKLTSSPELQEIIDKHRKNINFILPQDLVENNLLVKGIFIYGAHRKVNGELMASLPNLRVISNCGVGVDHIDVDAATKRGIKVGNTPGVVQDCTADLTFALLLASARNITQGDAMVRQPGFTMDTRAFGTKVTGSTLGIVGLGGVGSAVASRALGFKMRILYHSRKRKEREESLYGAQYCKDLKDLLSESDFVVVCAALTPETRHMIAATELSYMKPSATLINVARGGLVNHEDLATALKNGIIHGAALDVTEPEPLPHDHVLLTLPNVIVSPHVGTYTMTTRGTMLEMAMDNLLAGINGNYLPNPLN